MAKKEIFYPINKETGELCAWVWQDYPDDVNGRIEWVQNKEWHDEIKYNGYHRGRSAAGFNFKSEIDGKNYPMFMTDFDACMRNEMFFKSKLIGTFTFCKRGCNYGIRLIYTDDN